MTGCSTPADRQQSCLWIGSQHRGAREHDNHRPRACRRAKPAPLDEAIAVFRSLLITQPELVRLEQAFFLKEEDSGISRPCW